MNEFQTSSIIQWYEDLEDRLAEFLKFVPFVDRNLEVSSPRLVGVITESCSILDSLFYEATPQTVTIDDTVKNRDDLHIDDYAKLYAGSLKLPTTKSVAMVSPPVYLIPFKEWESIAAGGHYIPTPWWSAYTKLKHTRIGNLEKATLRNAVDALSGLHQVIARLPSLARAILRHEWLQLGGYNPEIVLAALEGASQLTDTYLVESKLFAVPVGPESFPDNIAALRPLYYKCSSRFFRFFGRM
jgi:hypothetical protein